MLEHVQPSLIARGGGTTCKEQQKNDETDHISVEVTDRFPFTLLNFVVFLSDW